MISPIYFGVIAIGLVHGLEPAHGWPIALVYSSKKKKPFVSGFVSAGIIAVAHFVSSIAVVVAYVVLRAWLNFDAPIIKYFAAALLLVLAYRFFREKPDQADKQHGHSHDSEKPSEHEHEHEHPGDKWHTHWHQHRNAARLSLWNLVTLAFVLGFAHEEEFALLGLVAAGADALTLMIAYGLSVSLTLVAVTLLGIKVYQQLEPRFIQYEKYFPKISALVLATMAIIIIVW